ncbi:glycerophosphodiester phosphodiesterase domain-containing protein 4-like isoform X2 [Vicugna pacos]|uniref:Glycerophosphodiester phosphodiesterase domain-containing protein 4-like isoform X2 n=1 Tax=Vicugna pacos TaxID=30538 RepID=A0ABM5DWF4_VICPA
MPKKANRIKPRSQKTRRRKKGIPWIVRIFSHQCYVAAIIGCYSCHWKVKREKKSELGSCCCSWRELLFYPWLLTALSVSVLLLFVWVESSNEYNGFDWVVFLGIGVWFFWSIVLLSLFGILATYTSLLFVLGFLLCWEGIKLHLHRCHKILILLVILICSFFFWLLCTYWKDRWLTIGLSLQVYAPYLHLSSISVMVLLSWPVAFYLIHLEGEALQVAVGLPFFLILLCLYVMPFGNYSPCIQEKDKLGPKPSFFGHRGAPMLGPENTMMSFEKAVEHGAFGLESDVHISYDHVPFLMHDLNLRRTTNIKEVLPNASLRHPSLFDWDFLSTLNAGKWFSHSRIKPFYHMKPLSEVDKEKAGNQKIPKLTDLLELAQKEKKFVIFDINVPTPKHFHRVTYVRHLVRVILDSKIEQHLIFWLPGIDRKYVRSTAPGFQHVGRLFPIERLTKENISRINVDYKRLFYNGLREYKAANININLYIVNEPWLFSLAWCSRIQSVTTDNIQVLNQINHPYFFMTPSFYMFMWILLDVVSAIFIFAIFYFHWWRERSKKEKLLKSTSIFMDTQSVSLRTGKSENLEAPDLSMESSTRVMEIPWSLAALTKNVRKHPASKSEPVMETMETLMLGEDDVTQPVFTTKTFKPTQAPIWEASREPSFQTALPSLMVNETISSIDVPHPETQPEKPPESIESFEESSFLFSATSSPSLYSFELSSKKN